MKLSGVVAVVLSFRSSSFQSWFHHRQIEKKDARSSERGRRHQVVRQLRTILPDHHHNYHCGHAHPRSSPATTIMGESGAFLP